MSGSVVLLSGGLDSTVALAATVADGGTVCALNFFYGQKSAAEEISASRRICASMDVEFIKVPLLFLADCARESALVDQAVAVPDGEEAIRGEHDLTDPGSVWIPNRNGYFINAAAALAEARGFTDVVIGINAEEARVFPDNTMKYLRRVNRALELSTLNKVTVKAPTGKLTKRKIVRLGTELNVDFSLIYSCYNGTRPMCGQCESCRRTARAFKKEGHQDIVEKLW